MANSATFRIRRVKCRDEMGGQYREKFGNDEIKCAVFSADLRGSTRNSGRIDVYDDFDDGDVKEFDPPKEAVTLDLAGTTGTEVELAFSVLLIESQLTQGNTLQKAWDAFVKIYGDAIKEELAKRSLTLAVAQAVARPGYLSPAALSAASSPGGVIVDDLGSIGTVVSPSATDGATGTGTGTGTGTDEKSTAEKVGDAFIVALVTACVMFGVKYAGAGVSALIGWAQDKLFPPVVIKPKIDASTPPGSVPPNATGVVEFRGHDGIYEMEWDILVR